MKICLTNKAKRTIKDLAIGIVIVIPLTIILTSGLFALVAMLSIVNSDGSVPYYVIDIEKGLWVLLLSALTIWLYYWLKRSIYIKNCG